MFDETRERHFSGNSKATKSNSKATKIGIKARDNLLLTESLGQLLVLALSLQSE